MMNFIYGLPLMLAKKDFVWVIVNRLTKYAHFLPIWTDYSLQKLAKLYVSEIVTLHGVPVLIVSNWDLRCTSRLQKKLHEALGTRLDFSTAYHPQTDGQLERVIHILEDMLRSCIIDFKGSQEDHLSLAEFANNNSFQSTIQMVPYEALYDLWCQTPLCQTKLGERQVLGPKLVSETENTVKLFESD